MAPPTVLVVDHDGGARQSLRLSLEAGGARVACAGTGAGALEALERGSFDAVLLDLRLGDAPGLDVLREIRRRQPHVPVVVVTAHGSSESAAEAAKLGAIDSLQRPFTPDAVREAARKAVEIRRSGRPPEARLDREDGSVVFRSESWVFSRLLGRAKRAAASDCAVLLRGESGTGKTEIARWIHANSPRASGPFVTVDCTALSPELMSSTLFGHTKGAFTGATGDVTGKVHAAQGGTLFLDEVGELGADPQARILRFINDQTYERVGESRERRADVRIVAATHRPLEQEVRAGRFREDLLFRLNVITLTLPPLRERGPDVLPLAQHYLTVVAARARRRTLTFSWEAERRIEAHAWPGNLRELHHTVERAAAMAEGDVIEAEDLGLDAGGDGAEHASGEAIALGGDVTLERLEREHIARVCARTPKLEEAARILGIGIATLRVKRRRYGLV